MDIKELKTNIEKNNVSSDFMIWLMSDDSSNIIAHQYLNKIAEINNLSIKQIESISDIPDASFIEDTNLYIIKQDDWNISDSHDNCIVICTSTKDKRAIKFPKLESWQVIDYLKSKITGLDDQLLNLLADKYGNNYWRLINDLEKLSSFDSVTQSMLFSQMIEEGQFNYATNYNIWDLSNAIIKKDTQTINNILKVIEYIDVEPLGLAKVLYNNFKTIVSIQTNPNVNYNDLGISNKQFFVIKNYNCGFYQNDKLIEILKLLTNVEYLFKYEELNLEFLIDYMICKIIGD